ncbi:patatin-like phospholipase family protein [Pseudonocardia sp. KRD291]|uniref:patatin-like phospholipase family protein n=1 Tax=Pseudonocardia sp. KRD291 TaxID=2792007 RepID=UPI001C4A4090|nr:patatin-like phospholipase family protein [Pseudonocardia sp. KRD291]MBW0105287.1 patatin-like phospholipase family protein [Pseudonocardia sp. KRD291]
MSSAEPAGPNIVIACQGGGSHSAFGAGVLGGLLSAPELDGHRVTGLSGTSGGAINALLGWTALRDGDRASAARRLDAFWADNAASGPIQALLNTAVVGASILQNLDALPGVSPYLVPQVAAAQFRSLLQRHVDFDAITADPGRVDPLLVLGAVDVLSGDFRAFSSHRERITAEVVAASAAIPNLFRAVETAGGTFWDGLFSQNPPVRDLLAALPDELWVVQITPSAVDRLPRTLTEIVDRRGELSGNLSLYQELAFVETLNRLIDDGRLQPGGEIGRTVIRVIELPREILPRALGAASKSDRSPAFLQRLTDSGKEQAEKFLGALAFERAWADGDVEAVRELCAPGASLVADDPFPGSFRNAVHDVLDRDVGPDLAHKQVSGDTVTWALRAPGIETPCVARATFDGRRVSELRLGRRTA